MSQDLVSEGTFDLIYVPCIDQYPSEKHTRLSLEAFAKINQLILGLRSGKFPWDLAGFHLQNFSLEIYPLQKK